MKKMIILITILISILLIFSGCSTEKSQYNDQQKPTSAIYEKISPKEANALMNANKNTIVLDVRTEAEYEEGHIDGSILIPDYELKEKAEEILTDKAATILIYCRSGRRSASAARILQELGYTAIYDFGGIIDWPYEVVTTN